MKKTSLSMWQGGKKLLLGDVFQLYPHLGDYQWTAFQFEGVGHIPGNLTNEQFAALLRDAPEGYALTADELNRFADGMQELHNLLMRGVSRDGATIEIEAFDSTTWEFGTEV
jgi:hypothetical protein